MVKGFLKGIFIIIGVLVLGISLLFFWMRYSSPVNQAGREYKKEIRAYRNNDIETIEDVYERLDILKGHYNSATFHKVQGGDKTEVTLSDIETLFGEPDLAHEEIDMSVADNVYQYKYDNITVNFHDRYSYIQEYVLEDFSGDLYEPQTIDQMFWELLPHDEGLLNEEDNPISEKELFAFIDETPTREIYQQGWVDYLALDIILIPGMENFHQKSIYWRNLMRMRKR